MKKSTKPKRGRPTIPDEEKAVRVNITLSRANDAKALKLGNGNRSKGIAIALDAMK